MLRAQKRGSFQVMVQAKAESVDCPLINISLGGICLACREPLSRGKIVGLVFNIPGEVDPVFCKARVCWCRPEKDDFYKTGLCFTQLTRKDQERIMQFVIMHSLPLTAN